MSTTPSTCPLQTFTADLSSALDEIQNAKDLNKESPQKANPSMDSSQSQTPQTDTPQKNRGTGAGGANTNKNGLTFEEKTSSIPHLLEKGFTLKKEKEAITYYYRKDESSGETKEWFFFQKSALKKYCKKHFNKNLYREPDECFMICQSGETKRYILKVVEKKNQNVPGSVDTKLYAGPGFKYEYKESLGENFTIDYAFTLNTYLIKVYNEPKKEPMRKFNQKEGIPIFEGDSDTYYAKLFHWIGLETPTSP